MFFDTYDNKEGCPLPLQRFTGAQHEGLAGPRLCRWKLEDPSTNLSTSS